MRHLVGLFLVSLAFAFFGCAVDEADPELFESRLADPEVEESADDTGADPPEGNSDRSSDRDAPTSQPPETSPECDPDGLDVAGSPLAVWPMDEQGRRGPIARGRETAETLVIHEVFEDVVPPELRSLVCVFVVFDGQRGDDTAGYASLLDPSAGRFELAVEVDELGRERTFTVAHEFAHVLSLGPSDVDDEAYRRFDCDGVGREIAVTCVLPGSELDLWVETFWDERLLAEHAERVDQDGDLLGFYDDHRSLFYNDYAATDPSEDFAETFGVYVLDLPVDSAVLQAKVDFFDEHRQFAAVRDHFQGS